MIFISFLIRLTTAVFLIRHCLGPLFVCSEAVARRWSVKKVLLKFLENSPVSEIFFKKVAGPQLANFPVNFAKTLRTPFFTEHLWRTAFVC